MSCDEIHAESQTADKDARLNCKQIRQVIAFFYRRYKKNLYGKQSVKVYGGFSPDFLFAAPEAEPVWEKLNFQ